MPMGCFDWMTAVEARVIQWLGQTDDQPLGYFGEARIHYLFEMHHAHND